MKVSIIALAAVLAAGAAIPASATTYVLNYTATSGSPLPTTAHIRFSTSNTLNGLGGYDILTASGTINSDTITGVAPINPPGFNTDNTYFAADPVFTSNGLGVTTNVLDANIWGNGAGSYSLYSYNGGYYVATDGVISITAVPEAATWAMLFAGFGMVGVAARRRKAVVAA